MSVFGKSYNTDLYDLHCVVGWMVVSWPDHLSINAGCACRSVIQNVFINVFVNCHCSCPLKDTRVL